MLVSKAVEAVSKAVEAKTAEEAVGPEGAGVVVEAEAMLPVVVVRRERVTTVVKWAISRPIAPIHLPKRGRVVGIPLQSPLSSIKAGHGISRSSHTRHNKANILTLCWISHMERTLAMLLQRILVVTSSICLPNSKEEGINNGV